MIPACSRSCYTGMGGSPVSEGYFSTTSHVLSGLPLFQLDVVSRALYWCPLMTPDLPFYSTERGLGWLWGPGVCVTDTSTLCWDLQRGADGFRKKISCFLSCFLHKVHMLARVKSFLSLKKKTNPQKLPPLPQAPSHMYHTKLAKPMEKDFAFWQQSWLRAHCGPNPKPTGAEGACTDFNGPWTGSGWEESAPLHPWGCGGVISSFCSVVSPNMWCCNRYLDLHQSKWIRLAL